MSKRALATISSTMAGTRKAEIGRSPLDGADPAIGIEAWEEPPAQAAAERTRYEQRPTGRGKW